VSATKRTSLDVRICDAIDGFCNRIRKRILWVLAITVLGLILGLVIDIVCN